MIAWLKGELLEKRPPVLLVNVNGIGYEVEAPVSALVDLPKVGETVTLFVHMVVREDAQLLFGFSNKQQRDLFRSLIKVNGVGPKVALAVLSTLSASELMLAMTNDDITELCKVPGIGKKTAQRLVVEMKDRLEKEFGDLASQTASSGTTVQNDQQDAIAALIALGYKASEAGRVVKALPSDLSGEEIIRQALRVLSGKVL